MRTTFRAIYPDDPMLKVEPFKSAVLKWMKWKGIPNAHLMYLLPFNWCLVKYWPAGAYLFKGICGDDQLPGRWVVRRSLMKGMPR